MAEYIERDKVLALKYWAGEGHIRYGVVDTDDIKKIPAADVAPVVRCKDCKHYVDCKAISKKCCYVHLLTPHPMPEDGFCSYGERKEGDLHA